MSLREVIYPLGYTFKHCKNIKGDIRFRGIRDVHFLKSEWENFEPQRSVSLKYLIYRGFFMSVIIFFFIFHISLDGMIKFYPIFLTHWSIMTQVLYSILFFVRVAMGYYCYQKNPPIDPEGQIGTSENASTTSKPIKWLQTIIWILQPICWVLPIIVTIGFWTTVYKASEYQGGSPLKLPASGMVHGANALFAIIDVTVIAIPVHATHFVYVSCYGLLYSIFAGLYEVLNGNYPQDKEGKPGQYIYSVLNWRNSPLGAFIASFAAILVAIFFFYWLYVAYAFRLLIVSFFKENTYEEHFYDEEGRHCPHCAHELDHDHGHAHDHTCPHCAHEHTHDHSHDHNCAFCAHGHDKDCVHCAHSHDHDCEHCTLPHDEEHDQNHRCCATNHHDSMEKMHRGPQDQIQMKEIPGTSAPVPASDAEPEN